MVTTVFSDFAVPFNVLVSCTAQHPNMASQSNDNVVPLIEAVVAYRNLLIERERQSGVADIVAIRDTTLQIERWLVEFAYQRIVQDY